MPNAAQGSICDAFEALPSALRAEYLDISQMELAAFLSWLLAKAGGRSLNALLADAQRRPGLWQEVEKSWDGLNLDEKSDWVPADHGSFLENAGRVTFLVPETAAPCTPNLSKGEGKASPTRRRLRVKTSPIRWPSHCFAVKASVSSPLPSLGRRLRTKSSTVQSPGRRLRVKTTLHCCSSVAGKKCVAHLLKAMRVQHMCVD